MVLFWKDFWVNDELLCDKFSRLLSFVLDDDASVATLQASNDLFSHFALRLSDEAFQELHTSRENPIRGVQNMGSRGV
jgi:hypothetical protein